MLAALARLRPVAPLLLPLPHHALCPQSACDKTFAQVAGEVPGLSILKTVVSQVGRTALD